MDSVLALDCDIKKALANKEGVMAVFLDVEKAYALERGTAAELVCCWGAGSPV